MAERDGLVRLARLLTGSDETAEELVQEAFVRLQTASTVPDNPGGYLRAILVNLCRDEQRRTARARRHVLPRPLPETPPEIDETWSALWQLPPRQRAAIVLRYYQDLPESEIAALLGCRPGTVKSTLSRGLAALRKELSR